MQAVNIILSEKKIDVKPFSSRPMIQFNPTIGKKILTLRHKDAEPQRFDKYYAMKSYRIFQHVPTLKTFPKKSLRLCVFVS
jgi:hypothetical protein